MGSIPLPIVPLTLIRRWSRVKRCRLTRAPMIKPCKTARITNSISTGTIRLLPPTRRLTHGLAWFLIASMIITSHFISCVLSLSSCNSSKINLSLLYKQTETIQKVAILLFFEIRTVSPFLRQRKTHLSKYKVSYHLAFFLKCFDWVLAQ